MKQLQAVDGLTSYLIEIDDEDNVTLKRKDLFGGTWSRAIPTVLIQSTPKLTVVPEQVEAPSANVVFASARCREDDVQAIELTATFDDGRTETFDLNVWASIGLSLTWPVAAREFVAKRTAAGL